MRSFIDHPRHAAAALLLNSAQCSCLTRLLQSRTYWRGQAGAAPLLRPIIPVAALRKSHLSQSQCMFHPQRCACGLRAPQRDGMQLLRTATCCALLHTAHCCIIPTAAYCTLPGVPQLRCDRPVTCAQKVSRIMHFRLFKWPAMRAAAPRMPSCRNHAKQVTAYHAAAGQLCACSLFTHRSEVLLQRRLVLHQRHSPER